MTKFCSRSSENSPSILLINWATPVTFPSYESRGRIIIDFISECPVKLSTSVLNLWSFLPFVITWIFLVSRAIPVNPILDGTWRVLTAYKSPSTPIYSLII